ncbi:hypothetical protein GCM10022255_043290 [Dactylosporangium darangshiense]|uniref:Uncharacterized protein n=1 Tax=Dactylosporangium darangshiense TaxID=579108 RepID=A0ABP8DAH8_9ACTN
MPLGRRRSVPAGSAPTDRPTGKPGGRLAILLNPTAGDPEKLLPLQPEHDNFAPGPIDELEPRPTFNGPDLNPRHRHGLNPHHVPNGNRRIGPVRRGRLPVQQREDPSDEPGKEHPPNGP